MLEKQKVPILRNVAGMVAVISFALSVSACNQAEKEPISTAITTPNLTEPADVPSEPSASPSFALDIDSFSKEDAISLLEMLSEDMWMPYVTQENFTVPDYVEDNAETHLAMRWPEYYLAFLEKHPNRKLVSIDTIKASAHDPTQNEDGSFNFTGIAEIQYTRKDATEGGVVGTNVEYTLKIVPTDGEVKITAIDMSFATDYARMKEEVAFRAKDSYPTIKMIDSVVDTAIRNIQ